MSHGKFASLDSSLLARKGNAAPAAPAASTWPTPAIPPAAESVATSVVPSVQHDAQGGSQTLSEPRSDGGGQPQPSGSQSPIMRNESAHRHTLRQKLSIRLVPEQLRRLKAASMQLGFSQQQIVTAALDSYFDNLSEQQFPGCGCLKRDVDDF